jgi:hypothetical protein
MAFIKNVNLLLRLILELCVVVSVGYWGFHIRGGSVVKWIVGMGAPIILMVIWGTFIAPNSAHQLPAPLRLCLELVVFGIGACALWASGFSNLAKVYSICVIVNMFLLWYWKQ